MRVQKRSWPRSRPIAPASAQSRSATATETLSGDIVATHPSSFGDDQTLTFDVNWTSVSSNIQAALGSNSGVGQSTVVFSVSGQNVVSADLHLSASGSGPHSPTPEPSTLLLLGTGLLGVGLAFRRYSLA